MLRNAFDYASDAGAADSLFAGKFDSDTCVRQRRGYCLSGGYVHDYAAAVSDHRESLAGGSGVSLKTLDMDLLLRPSRLHCIANNVVDKTARATCIEMSTTITGN